MESRRHPQGVPRPGKAKDEGPGSASGWETPDEGYFRESPRRSRRRRPWLRVVFGLFVAIEVVVLVLVSEFSPVFRFEITTVTAVTDGTSVIGNNPELLYPIELAGSLCRPAELSACVANDTSAATLATVCCTELLDPAGDGPEQTIGEFELFAYVLIIPALLLLSRGFLLGRVWALRPLKDPPCGKPSDDWEGPWGKKRWHLRVGFYALDSVLGLGASVVTASLFAVVGKVTAGRPRPNYFALQLFSDHAVNGETFYNESIFGWPSRHAAAAMAGLLFLAFVLWRDLMALVQWRRRAHPTITLVLAVLGGFAVAALPLSAILIGITRVRDYWHRPDDVVAGLVLGTAAAHWSFRFVVMMPFNHEIGSPHWTPDPKWLDEEEREWLEEEEEMLLCSWKGRRRRRHAKVRADPMDHRERRGAPTQVSPPRRAPEADVLPVEKIDTSPA